MSDLYKYVEKVIPKDQIYDNKPVSHWFWWENGGHLITANYNSQELYIVLQENQSINLDELQEDVILTEVIEELHTIEEYGPLKGIHQFQDEITWLGKFSFLGYPPFQNHNIRELVAANYDKIIYISEKAFDTFDLLRLAVGTGNNLENHRWAFYWVNFDSPFYMEDGILLPRVNTTSSHTGIIWFNTKEEADVVLKAVCMIAQKVNRRDGSTKYDRPEIFLEEFISIMRKLSQRTIDLEDISLWEDCAFNTFTGRSIEDILHDAAQEKG